jgi:SAM-dependent methyltransferase
MLDDLKTNCSKAQVVLSDMRDFSFPFKFDFTYCMFSSFGYFADPQDDFKVLSKISDNLKTDGLFLLDLRNSTRTFQEKMEKKIGDEIHHYTINRYSKEDISKMLERAGLQPFEWYGDYNQTEYNTDSPRMIIFSRKF